MTDLGTLYGLPVSLAASINNKGQVVGFSQDLNSNNTVASLWQNGVLTDLNTLIPAGSPLFLLEALGINDGGQIAGYAFNASTGEVHGYLATPVPGSESTALVAQSQTSERPKIALPENVRTLLQRQIDLRRHWPGLGARGLAPTN